MFKSYEQKQIFIGTLLGDGCIFKDKRAKRYRMNLAHSLKQEDYFKMKYEKLLDIFENDYKYCKQYDKRTKKTYEYLKVQTLTNDFFTSWYKKIYKNGKKTISKEIANELDKLGIAIIYFDDGYKCNQNHSVNISLCDYDLESVQNLKERIEYLFDIETTITTRMGIRVPVKYGKKFKDELKPYATQSVLYKLI